MINPPALPILNDQSSTPLLDDRQRTIFLHEALDLFTHKRQGHFIHRMYMTPASLACWSEFMKHSDYYVTRSEIKIIRDYARIVGDMAYGEDGIIGIENGPGTKSAMIKKSTAFFSAMPGLHTYLGRDWSPAIVENIPKTLRKTLPGVRVIPDLSNFLTEKIPSNLGTGRKVMAEFGVTCGNMEGFPADPFPRHVLLRDLSFNRNQLDKDDLYVSTFDANQNEETILKAYTSDWLTLWGQELFRTMKRELPIEGDFDCKSFFFRPVWHAENHISVNNMVAMRTMEFSMGGQPFKIYRDDMFGITNSYKIPAGLYGAIAADAGFETIGLYQDSQKRMSMSVLKAV